MTSKKEYGAVDKVTKEYDLLDDSTDVLLLSPDEHKTNRAQLRQGQGSQARPWISFGPVGLHTTPA